MSTLAFTSLPPEVQAFLKEKGLHRFKTVEVSPFYREDVVRELPPIPVNLENTNKPAAYSYAVSPSGHSVKANYNRVMGAWPHHTEEVAESIQLPVEHGPWTIIHVPRNWAGAELGVSIRHGKLDTRYQSQKSKLTGLAAAMLYVYAKTRGMYRKRSTEAMESYERQVGPVWIVVRDELLEQGLVTIQKGGQLRVTPRGAEVAGRIPPSYDPDNWVYRRTAEATHMPSEGLFGLGAHIATADMGTVTVRLTDPDPTEKPPREFDLVMKVNVLQPTPNEPDQRWRMRLTAASPRPNDEGSFFITKDLLPDDFTRPFIVYEQLLTYGQTIPYKATILDTVWKESVTVNMDRVMENTVTPYQRPPTISTYVVVGQRGWARGDTLEAAIKEYKRYGYQTLPQLRASMKRSPPEAVIYRINRPEGVYVMADPWGGAQAKVRPGFDPSLAQATRFYPIKPEGRTGWREEPAEPHDDSDLDGLPPRVLSPEQRAELLQRYYGGEEMTTRRVAKMPRPGKTYGGGPKPTRVVDNPAAVRAAYEAGVPVRTLAQQHGVSYRQVHNLTRGIDNETAKMRRRLLQAGLPDTFTLAQAAHALGITTKAAYGLMERMVQRGLVKKEALGPPHPTQYRLGDTQYPPTGERVTYG